MTAFPTRALYNPFDELVHLYYFLTTRPQGFSPCGHATSMTPLAMAQAVSVVVDCVECIAAGDELPAAILRGMTIQDQQNRVFDELSKREDDKIVNEVNAIIELNKPLSIEGSKVGSYEPLKERIIEAPREWTHEVCDAVEADTGDER